MREQLSTNGISFPCFHDDGDDDLLQDSRGERAFT